MVPTPESGKICTDGENIEYDPEIVDSFELPVIKGVLAHETMHVAFLHHCRGKSKEHQVWNQACNYAINSIILNAGLQLPENILYDVGFNEKSAEDIYGVLSQRPKQEEGEAGNDSNDSSGNGKEQSERSNSNSDNNKNQNWGEVKQVKAKDIQKQETEWRTALKAASQFAERQGKLPGGMERILKDLLNPEAPWEVLLRDFIDRTARNDYSFKRPNVRYVQSGFYLPSLISNELPSIIVASDTSGSMSEKDIAVCEVELQSIMDLFHTEITVLYCDSHLHTDKIQTFSSGDVIKLKPYGGGGTSFIPVFEYIDKNEEPACLIYFTDMEGSFPKETPNYPVLWINTGKYDSKPPFGEYFKMHN